MEAYCMKCRAKQEIESPELTILKNGRPATKGICTVCKTKVSRIEAKQDSVRIPPRVKNPLNLP